MKQISTIGDLPVALNAIARGFLSSEPDNPEIWLCSPDEIKGMIGKDDLVFQIIIDKAYGHYYIVGVGESTRSYQGQLILLNPVHTATAHLYFSKVSAEWVLAEKTAIAEKQIYDGPITYDEESNEFIR